jgi:hypothetical protein
MRPCLGYSNISWVTQEKMKMRREAAKKVPKETLTDPEPISHPNINVEKEEVVVIKEEVSDELKKQKNFEKREVLKRSENKESFAENKSTILERDV